jgi:hypothetical protein
MWPSASSGDGPDIVESSSLESFSLLYNVGGAGIDWRLTSGISVLQYTDNFVIYASGNVLQRVRESLQQSLDLVDIFMSDLGLSIITTKSEVLLFSNKRSEASPRPTLEV